VQSAESLNSQLVTLKREKLKIIKENVHKKEGFASGKGLSEKGEG